MRTDEPQTDIEVAGTDIAIVGMSGRFPGAADVAGLWSNLLAGASGITRFTDDELRTAGVSEQLIGDTAYVKAGAVIDGIELFDAGFFGIGPKEAQIIDPQQRLFLEHSWHALEDAACDPSRFDGAIGVFGGSAWSSYLQNNLAPSNVAAAMGDLALGLANDKDSLTTRVAHTLGLTGPSYSVQSYCSTSLVAVCAAASSLAGFECDLALAGGVNIAVPHRVGYLYQQGGIVPPDGECRAFDAAGLGAPVGSGVGVVALRRLEDAVADGDRVYAVIRGWAVNNDGGRKVGFTAPGVQGQAAVIAEALSAAGLRPADIDYVEAHGTGTALGDASEIAALQQVFGSEQVLVGSVKTNVGHLDRAAGVTGLIKASLALRTSQIPPTRNLRTPNPQLAGGETRLDVVTELLDWPARPERLRRAGVSAFGIGGTNAHVVLEEAPDTDRPAAAERPQVLVWSARSQVAADEQTARLAAWLRTPEATRLDDVAHTLQSGRRVFEHRRTVVASSIAEAADLLERGEVEHGAGTAPVAFVFTGTGDDLDSDEPAFLAAVAECGAGPRAFAVRYAAAKLLMAWGVQPALIAGDGVGRYVAGTLAGVFDLATGLALAAGGVLPDGATLSQPSVPLPSSQTGAEATDREYWAADGTAPVPAGYTVVTLPGSVAAALGQVWLGGGSVDWTAYHQGHDVRRTGLPGYPFQRDRYWIDPPAPMAGSTVVTTAGPVVTLHAPKWTVAPLAEPVLPLGRCALVGSGPIATGLLDRLRAEGVDTILVDEGPDGLADRLRTLDAGTVVDLRAVGHGGAEAADAHVLPIARLLDALAADASRDVTVVLVTENGQAVGDGDRPVPAQAAVAVLPVVAAQEYLNLRVRVIDLPATQDPAAAISDLAADLCTPSTTQLAAYRAGVRHTRDFEPAETSTRAPLTVRAGGTYLITGGLGDVGLRIAEHLARRGAGRLVLAGRSGPGRVEPAVIGRIRTHGAEVVTPRLDVTDAAATAALFAELGTVDGIVHAAAQTAPDTFRPLRNLDETVVRQHFGAKVDGAAVLARTIDGLPAERRPDFCVVFSSTSSVLGGLAFGSYAAANAALTAVAQQQASTGTRWIAPAWDTWDGTLDRVEGGVGATMAAHAMTTEQGLAAFDRVLAAPRASIVVAAAGLSGRLPGEAIGTGAAEVIALVPTGARFPRPELPQPYAPPLTATERALAELWSEVLGVEPVGTRDNFFDLSGNSLLALQSLTLVKQRFGIAVPSVTLFEAPTVHALAAILDQQGAAQKPEPARAKRTTAVAGTGDGVDRRIAIVGLAGRFPGAGDVASFWRNLRDGVESISFFSEEELTASGVEPELIHNPNYVPARPVLDDVAGFDAAFFGISPRMAALTDPQQRLFLEVCWEALEQAGYAAPEHRGRVGVYGGSNISTYLLGMPESTIRDGDVSTYEIIMGNDKDALTTTVSYLFDLYGPSVAVQTFCSTSLVATHLAVQSLRSGECELALAGGVSIRVPQKVGHVYGPGGMESPDGHVRTFDAQAHGSMFGDGAAVVVLKRLEDAVRDGDHIWSVLRGSAMNNDGALKVGYTAPSVVGQARVVEDALADAGVTGDDISYVEAHGTATELGDPIELAALTRAFGPTSADQYCPIGSVKTNVGHLDRAAGVTGLIKTSLALHDEVIPPTLHYTSPNPDIDFEHSPFYVNTELSPWSTRDGRVPMAGINSLGMGGTNVHVVVEQAPRRDLTSTADDGTTRRYQVVPVSARNVTAADEAVARLGAHLQAEPGARLADVAYTLQVGRKTFEHRRVVTAVDTAGAAAALAAGSVLSRTDTVRGRPVALVFTGVGEQYPGLAGELYRREPAFRAALDECLALLPGVPADLLTGTRGDSGGGLAALLGRSTGGGDPRAAALERTEVAQPALFAVEYALARTLMAWGVKPATMLGYSLGEYVVACLAGVLSLPDAAALVAKRAELIAGVERGAMLAVSLPEAALRERFALGERGLDVAALNGPQVTVVAGPVDAVDELAGVLRGAGIACRPLSTTHAFHSRMLAGIAEPLTEWIRANVTLNPPQLPYLSNVSGQVVTAAEVTDPGYWARHMCGTVRFADAAAVLLADPELAVVEIGPGQSLGALLRGMGDDVCPPRRWPMLLSTLPAGADRRADDAALADCVARLWLLGADIDWPAVHRDGGAAVAPGRVPLPTYPFQRHRYWVEPADRSRRARTAELSEGPTPATLEAIADLPKLPEEQWLHLPVWQQTAAPAPADPGTAPWLVFTRDGLADDVAARLGTAGVTVAAVRPGDEYAAGPDGYTVRPGNGGDLAALLRDLRDRGRTPQRVLHLWALGPAPTLLHERVVPEGLHTLVALAKAAGELGLNGWHLDVAVAGTQPVLGEDVTDPYAATLVGPCRVIPLEYPTVTTRLVDVAGEAGVREIDGLVSELLCPPDAALVALRRGRRWVPDFAVMPAPAADPAVLREDGVYLITGGLGGIALGLAEQLAAACPKAKLVLLARTGLGEAGERVEKVGRLRALGAQVVVVVGDVSDPGAVRRAYEVARERFGGLHGVFHVAGVPGMGLMQFKRNEELDQVIAPKLGGALAITEALRLGKPDEVALDFLVFFSSITSATGGGPGQVDYCAGNAFLDSYAAQLAGTGRRVLSVCWGEWTWNAWSAGLAGYADSLQEFFTANRARIGIGFDDGWRSLLRALATGEPQVVVSTQDFPTMVRFSRHFTVDAVTSPELAGDGGARHPRPELVTAYQEPSGETEEAIAAVWAQTLRLDRVGVADNFFELGGNSLLGVGIVAAVRDRFALAELPPHVLYEAPTVAALARIVEQGGTTTDPDHDADSQVRAQLRRSGLSASAGRRRAR